MKDKSSKFRKGSFVKQGMVIIMKKPIIFIVLISLITLCFSGCNGNISVDSKVEGGKLSIVSTIFPPYDFTRQICSGNVDITMLLPPGAESHVYEPSAQDIIKIQNCDLFICVGGISDSWADKLLASMDRPVKTIKIMDCVNALAEELVPGMEEEESDDEEYDEHVWTYPKNAIKITESISKAVCEIDAKNAERYEANTRTYVEKLEKLDKDFIDFFSTVNNKTIIFGDRFPFRYFTLGYGLTYYAAFPGCSSKSEPSAATIAFLIDKVRAENISTVFHIEFSNHQIADSIAEATNTKTALLHTCHNVSKTDLANGATYLSLMEQNLNTLKKSMN